MSECSVASYLVALVWVKETPSKVPNEISRNDTYQLDFQALPRQLCWMMNFQSMLYSLLLLQCLVLGFYLVRERRLVVLRIFLFLLAFHMSLNLFETWVGIDLTSKVAPVLAQLYGPLLYLFFVELMYSDFKLKRQHLVHLLPAICAALLTPTIGNATFITI